ncbi:MAG: VOC family protein [Candidatus Eremiobacterota bacterium]
MKINHIALWTGQIENMKDFYVTYFGCIAGQKYTNSAKGFSSYFLTFTSGARLELMNEPDFIPETSGKYGHFAISTGSEDGVRELTERLRHNGVTVKSEPRWTGDGYYESVILDPDGNFIELTV